MKLRVYRTLWGVLAEADGASAESPFLGTEEGNGHSVFQIKMRGTFKDSPTGDFMKKVPSATCVH